jgi:hypothetical protein
LFYLFCFFCSTFGAEWSLVGLENDTILSLAVDNNNRLIAGTKNGGIKIHTGGTTWLDIHCPKIPVNKIVCTADSGFIAAIGAGSNSDGIYSARAIPAAPYYSVSETPFHGMMFPQSLCRTPEGDTIFFGGGNTIVRAYKDSINGEYGHFSNVVTPSDPFGMVKPRCTALLYLKSRFWRFYAGGYGYDESTDTVTGHLLWTDWDGDTLSVNSPVNVTCITAVPTIGSMGPDIFVGTLDDGLYHRLQQGASVLNKYLSYPGKGRVNDMIPILIPEIDSALCVAEKNSVFVLYGTSNWVELGGIPQEPKCLAGYIYIGGINRFDLFAGTNKGVYRCDVMSVDIKNRPVNTNSGKVYIQQLSGKNIAFSFNVSRPCAVTITIINSAGRRITGGKMVCNTSGRQFVPASSVGIRTHTLPTGVYFLRLTIDKETCCKPFICW